MYKVSLENWKYYLSHQEEFNGRTHMRNYKQWILEDQDCKCSICGIETIWNDKPLNFILDHIDGNSDNNLRNNLRMICPNCESQLFTYKSRNKGKYKDTERGIGRKKYYYKYSKSEPISGNINSGHDDNVESLTGNADGNDVGTTD